MFQNIVAGILCVVCVVAGVWGWWFENGAGAHDSVDENIDRSVIQSKEGKEDHVCEKRK